MEANKSISRNQNGAIIVLGLFMAVFLVGILYYMVGIGDSILHKQRMQDAADAGAFSAAVMHARGMNIIALLNMVMAALMAILVAIRMVQVLCYIAQGALLIAGFFFPPASSFISPLETVNNLMEEAYNLLEDPIHEAIKVLHCAQVVVRKTFPLAAQVRVISEVRGQYKPPVKVMFIWPIYQELPAVDDTFDNLCKKAGQYTGELVGKPLFFLPEFILDGLSGAMASLAENASGYFCGDENYSQDTFEEPMAIETPEFKECKKGKEVPKGDLKALENIGQQEPDLSPACIAAFKQNMSSDAINDQTGKCAEHTTEDAGGTEHTISKEECETAQRPIWDNARTECKPDRGRKKRVEVKAYDGAEETTEVKNVDLARFRWQERKMKVRYRQLPKHLRGGVRKYETLEPEEISSQGVGVPPPGQEDDDYDWVNYPPCQDEYNSFTGVRTFDWTEWNTDPSEPLCKENYEEEQSFKILSNRLRNSGDKTPEGNGLKREEGTELLYFDVYYREVTEIMGCAYEHNKEYPTPKVSEEGGGDVDDWSYETMNSDGEPEQDSDSCDAKVPHKMKDGVELGSDSFQLRSFVVGSNDLNLGRRGVEYAGSKNPLKDSKLAAEKQVDGQVGTGVFETLSKFSFAQAEYYFSGGKKGESWGDRKKKIGDRNEWLWHMYWRARFRRFTISGIWGGSDSEDDSSPQPAGDFDSQCTDDCNGLGEIISGGIDDLFIH